MKKISDEIIKAEYGGRIWYPVGLFMDNWTKFIISTSNVISNNLSIKDKIALICRGSSGNILAGSIAYELTRQGFKNVVIVPIRKDETNSHSTFISEAAKLKYRKIIVVDDFIEQGNTLKCIISHLNKIFGYNKKYYMLAVNGNWTENNNIKIKFKSFLFKKFHKTIYYEGY